MKHCIETSSVPIIKVGLEWWYKNHELSILSFAVYLEKISTHEINKVKDLEPTDYFHKGQDCAQECRDFYGLLLI